MTELEGRYRIIRSLGKGAGGETFEAEDVRDGSRVALKRLVLAAAGEWKQVDLFEREARVLANLKHAAIPRYRDSFVVETPEGPVSYLAHDFAPGKSLRGWVESGWRPDEGEVVRIASLLLDVLTYLHSILPPVIHRDIKPDNVIRSDDGRLWLVDFGAVRDSATTMTGGSTVVGTYGYMAPEQFRGHAVPASDIYGVGATLLYLLGGKPPTEYPQENLKVSFRGQVRVSPFLARWVECALEPAPEDRFTEASDALAVLRGQKRRTVKKNAAPSRVRLVLLGSVLLALLGLAAVTLGVREPRVERPVAPKEVALDTMRVAKRLPDRGMGPDVALTPPRTFEGRHSHYIFSLGVSADGKLAASGSDAVIKLWNTATGKEIRSLGAHGGRVTGVHFLADDKRLLTAGGTTLKTWDVASGKELTTIQMGHGAHGITVSRDEQIVFVAGPDGAIHLWDLAKGTETTKLTLGQPVFSVALSHDGGRLAAGGRDGRIRVQAVPDGRVIAEWQAHTKTVNDLAFSPDDSLLASAGDDARVVLTSISTSGKTLVDSDFANADESFGVAFSPDGKLLAISSKDRTLSFVAMAGRFKIQSESVGAVATHSVFTKDGRLINAAGGMLATWTIMERGRGTPFPEPAADATGDPVTTNDDERRYHEISRLSRLWPAVSIEEIAAKVEAATDAHPTSPFAWIGQAQLELRRAYIDGTNFDPKGVASARAHLAKAESLGPKTAHWWALKAWVERAAKDEAPARHAIREAYALAPREPYAVLCEARLDEAASKYDVAVASLAQLVRSTKRADIHAWAYRQLASSYEALGDVDAAERAHRAAIAANPKNVHAHHGFAVFLDDVREPEKAIAIAEAALAISRMPIVERELARAHANLGAQQLWEGDRVDDAIHSFDVALGLDGKSSYALYGRAAAYRANALDRSDPRFIAKARSDLSAASNIEPKWPQPKQALRELDDIERRMKAAN